MTATLPKRQRQTVLKRFSLPAMASSLSLLVLTVFVVSRLFSFFPTAAVIVPFTLLVVASLSYLNAILLRGHRCYWYGAANVVFTGFKSFIFILLTWSWGDERFNDYAMLGHATLLFLACEGINFPIFLYYVAKPNPLIVNHCVSVLTSVVGGCAFVMIALSGTFTQPRRLAVRYSGYDPNLTQQVQVMDVDYGGSFGPRGGIHCEFFSMQTLGFFTSKSPLEISSASYQKYCLPELK